MATAEAKCSQCGKVHVRSKLELTFKRPDAIAALPEKERVSDAKESEDLCSLRSERFFVRAVLPLPVEGWEDPYRIGIWVEVQRSAFERILHLWEDPAQDKEPAFGAT